MAEALASLAPAGSPSTLLAEITAGLAAERDLHALLGRFLDRIVHLAGAQAGAVRVLDRDDHRMHLVGNVGLPGGVVAAERSGPGDCGACGAATHAGGPVWAEGLDPCLSRARGEYFGSGCERMLAVPLQHRGRVLGVYNLFYAHGHEPAPEALALLRTVGELLGMALENARLERENLRAHVAQERRAMAADLHDSIGQSLAFVKMRLPLLQDAVCGGDRAAADRYYQDVRAAVGQAHTQLRAVLSHLRTPMDPLGLGHALSESAQAFRQRGGVELEFANRLPSLRLAPVEEEQVLHIVQEALANITRHAAARHAWLQIARQDGWVQVEVQDDGAGLPLGETDRGTHFGLAIMRERASRLGGTLEVGARPGGGTRVCLRFPLAAADRATAAGDARASVEAH